MEYDLRRAGGAGLYPPHPDREFEGHPPPDAASTDIAVQNAIATINTIMNEDRRRANIDTLPDLAPQVALRSVQPHTKKKPQTAKAAPKARVGLWSRLWAFRPDARHATWALVFAAVLIWPRAVLIVGFALFCLALIGVAIFGPERMTDLRDRLRGDAEIALPKIRIGRLRGVLARLRAAREVEPDPFEGRPDPFERIARDLR
jgi:hypothetical protein